MIYPLVLTFRTAPAGNWAIRLHVSGHGLESDLRVAKDGGFAIEQEAKENPNLETELPYQVDDEHLKQWIEFLRHCGGFEVW
jgi:hypothetical protein